MEWRDLGESLTFDDVLIKPGRSDVHPRKASLASLFSRGVPVRTPLVSAAMDTVTEGETAIVMAQEGGMGVVHRNLPPKAQALEVAKVKLYETGVIQDPVTVEPDWTLERVVETTSRNNITGVPVIDGSRRLVGILTSRDLRSRADLSQKVRDVMTGKERLVCGDETTTLTEARAILNKNRIEKLPIIDKEGRIKGLITIKDILRAIDHPHATKDGLGRLRVAAAVGTGEPELHRARALVEAGADALVIDTAHGHSAPALGMVGDLKRAFPGTDVVAGNVATAEGARAIVKAGADAVKVGVGAGSICTTRVVAGVGVPQLSAVAECADACRRGGVPLISDGGTKYSGDVVKALAAGASTVMVGSLFAGTRESPGERILYKGRTHKAYRGMGSLGAMVHGPGVRDRYGQDGDAEPHKLVPEGIEGQVPYRGGLADNIFQLLGGLRAGMGYVGAKDLGDLRKKARFIRISKASLKESHPHDVIITKEAPNYSVSNR